MDVIINGVKYAPMPDVPTDGGLLAALDIRFDSDAGDNLTIRDYLRVLLTTLWEEKESFSGKRPLGNSGWEHELHKPLVEAGLIKGRMFDGWPDGVDYDEADVYVTKLIMAAFYGVQPK